MTVEEDVERLVAEYGEKWRRLITASLTWLAKEKEGHPDTYRYVTPDGLVRGIVEGGRAFVEEVPPNG